MDIYVKEKLIKKWSFNTRFGILTYFPWPLKTKLEFAEACTSEYEGKNLPYILKLKTVWKDAFISESGSKIEYAGRNVWNSLARSSYLLGSSFPT